jgi:hypothetical protein
MSETVKKSKMARRYGKEFKRQAVGLLPQGTAPLPQGTGQLFERSSVYLTIDLSPIRLLLPQGTGQLLGQSLSSDGYQLYAKGHARFQT